MKTLNQLHFQFILTLFDYSFRGRSKAPHCLFSGFGGQKRKWCQTLFCSEFNCFSTRAIQSAPPKTWGAQKTIGKRHFRLQKTLCLIGPLEQTIGINKTIPRIYLIIDLFLYLCSAVTKPSPIWDFHGLLLWYFPVKCMHFPYYWIHTNVSDILK